MRSSDVYGRALATTLIAFAIGLTTAATAIADPADENSTDPTAPAVPGASAPSAIAPASGDASPTTSDTCKQFSTVMTYAASGYEEFAYASAGQGNYVDYGNPFVNSYNATGRSALKEAAAAGLQLAGTPGLPSDVQGAMQAWSVDAAKLVLIMGLRGGGDSLNNAATELNTDTHSVQMSCAQAGTHA
jgi:hypothetical protein